MQSQRVQHTCATCAVVFLDAEVQRDHYKTDWHRYNLKRKVAELAPVTFEAFNEKMSSHEAQMKLLSGAAKGATGYCVACRKSFSTEKAYENHLGSKKHKDVAEAFSRKENQDEIKNNRLNRKPEENDSDGGEEEDDMEVEEVDSDEWEDVEGVPVGVTDCLFCSHHSRDMQRNLVHMSEAHSFFLPDAEYIVDLDGLIAHLGEKVGKGLMCLWCNTRSKTFLTLSAVQKHMCDKGHCKVQTDNNAMLEFARFFDYSTSYPEGEAGPDNNDEDEEVELSQLDDTGFQLVLPSGAKVGHRSLMKYYKQSLRPDRQLTVSKSSVHMLLNHYKALGWSGMSGSEAKKRAKDIKYVNKMQNKYYMQLGMKANRLQRHFLDPTMCC